MGENPYELSRQKVIPACLVYLFQEDPVLGRRILMIHRQGREGDFHSGKWNGLGGKFEPGESPWQAAAREVEEESGLALGPERFDWLGTLQFPNFKPHRSEDWWCSVLVATVSVAEAAQVPDGLRFSDEGSLHWIPAERLLELNLWEGDRHFLPRVLEGGRFNGTFWYRDGRLEEWILG